MADFFNSIEWWVYPLAITVVLLFWKAARWTGAVDTALKNLGESLSDVKNDIDKIQDDIKGIQDDIKGIFARLPSPKTVDASSPLQLTEFGEKISRETGARDWAGNHADILIEEPRD